MIVLLLLVLASTGVAFPLEAASATPTAPPSLASRADAVTISNSEELYSAVQLNVSRLRLAPGVYYLRRGALRLSFPLEFLGDVDPEGHEGANRPVLDCGGQDHGAMELLAGGFVVANIAFRSCGGAAAVTIDLRNSSTGIDGQIWDCAFHHNTGYLAGGVAVIRDNSNVVDLTLTGCSFFNNTGSTPPEPDQIPRDYDYSSVDTLSWTSRRSASSLGLGRGTYIISRCNFTSNTPAGSVGQLEALQVAAPLDLDCWQGPAEYIIEDSVFQDNAGRQGGAIYLHGYPDGETPTLGCKLRLKRVLIQDTAGYLSGAVLASCQVKGSSCAMVIEDSQVLRCSTEHGGVVTVRLAGMRVAATNLTLAHGIGGYAARSVDTTFVGCRFVNNTSSPLGNTVVGVSGGSFSAIDTVFSQNRPLNAYVVKAGAVSLSNIHRNVIRNCTFTDNGLHALAVILSPLELYDSRFLGNRARYSRRAKAPYGAALMLYGSTYTTVHNTVFEDNVAVAGAAVVLVGSQSAVFSNCTFNWNRAVSGGAIEIDNPGSSVVIRDSGFLGNSAADFDDWVHQEEDVLAATYTSIFPVEDGGPRHDDYTDSYGDDSMPLAFSMPVEGCGNGGGGALCVRGGPGSQVKLENVVLEGNRALMGGGVYATAGSRCRQQQAGCYDLALGPNVTITDNHAELAGGAVYWMYEQIVRTYCAVHDTSLAAPAWPGLLEQLQTHNFTAMSLAIGAMTTTITAATNSTGTRRMLLEDPVNSTDATAATDDAPMLAPPQPAPAPSATTTNSGSSGTDGGSSYGALQRYRQLAVACASWSGNSVGEGGYGPTIASSAFYHLPRLLGDGNPSSEAGSNGNAHNPTQAGVPVSPAETRLRLRRLGSLEQQSESARAPPPPTGQGQLLFASGDNIPVEVYIFDFYGQKVTRSIVDSPASVLVTCTSANVLGQKTAEAVHGVANFTQLLVRDKIGLRYSVAFSVRTFIREMGPVSINISVRPCRMNEELATSGDSCVPCVQGFYAIPTAIGSSGSNGNSSSGSAAAAACAGCPPGAICSSESWDNIVTPQDGYWHSGPWSSNIKKCPFSGACTYGNRTELLAVMQAKLVASATMTRGSAPSSSAMDSASLTYRDQQCAPGYQGNMCASCEEGYGRTSPNRCSRCRGPWVRFGYGLLVFGVILASIAATIRAALTPRRRLGNDHQQQQLADSVGSAAAVTAVTIAKGGPSDPPPLGAPRGRVAGSVSSAAGQQMQQRGLKHGEIPCEGDDKIGDYPAPTNGNTSSTRGRLSFASLLAAVRHRRVVSHAGQPDSGYTGAGTGTCAVCVDTAAEEAGRYAGSSTSDGLPASAAATSTQTRLSYESPRASSTSTQQGRRPRGSCRNNKPPVFPEVLMTVDDRSEGCPGADLITGTQLALDQATLLTSSSRGPGAQQHVQLMDGLEAPTDDPIVGRPRHRLGMGPDGPPIRTTPGTAAAGAPFAEAAAIAPPKSTDTVAAAAAAAAIGAPLTPSSLDDAASKDAAAAIARGGAADEEEASVRRATKDWVRSKRMGRFAGRSWRQRVDVVSEHATVIKILVSYLQVVSLIKNTPLSWPRALLQYFNVIAQISSAASTLAALDCAMRTDALPKSAQTAIIGVLSPTYWFAALCMFWLLRSAWLHYRGHLSQPGAVLSYLRIRCIITAICVVFIMYPSVVSQLFSLFACQQIDTGPQQLVCVEPWNPDTCSADRLSVGSYWTQDLELRCYEGIHLRLCLILGVPGVLLFAVGMPLLSAAWLYRNRQLLWEEEFAQVYGSLYQEYEDGYYFWESIVMLRKLAVTAVIVFAGTYRWQITLLLALGVIALALMGQVSYRPFESDAMDELERLGLVATLVTFYLATYFMSDSVGDAAKAGLSIAILVITVLTVVILVLAILRELHRAAIYKLLRITSARGDLPLSFVLRIGLLYLGWKVRAGWTAFRIWLDSVAPRCFPLDPPPPLAAGPVDNTTVNFEAAGAADDCATVMCYSLKTEGAGIDRSYWISEQQEKQQQRRASATGASAVTRGAHPIARTASLRSAWERHGQETWTRQVMRLADGLARASPAAESGDAPSDEAGAGGAAGDSGGVISGSIRKPPLSTQTTFERVRSDKAKRFGTIGRSGTGLSETVAAASVDFLEGQQADETRERGPRYDGAGRCSA